MTAPAGLRIRKLADKSDGERVARYHPITGERMLLTPLTVASPDFDYERMRAEPWPLKGLMIEGTPPKKTIVSTSLVTNGKKEGWVELEDSEPVHRPSGPADDLWGSPAYTFLHASVIVFKCVNGDLRYKVTKQPDKYVENNTYDERGVLQSSGDPNESVTDEIYAAGDTRVDHFYELELEG